MQNEIDEHDAELLIKHGCQYVVEGANMPSTNEAIHKYNKVGAVYTKNVFHLMFNTGRVFRN